MFNGTQTAGANSLVYALAELPSVLGVGAGLVRKLVRSGNLPARKLGRRTVVLRTDLTAFLVNLPVIANAPAADGKFGALEKSARLDCTRDETD